MATNDTDETTNDADVQDQPDLAAMNRALEGLVNRGRPRGRAGGLPTHGGDRDVFEALGYPQDLTYDDYRQWYNRGGIAQAIIEKPASKTWEEAPDLVDDGDDGEEWPSTDFEEDVAALWDADDERTNLDRGLRHYFERVDQLARIGNYAVLFLGLSDADSEAELADPVQQGQISSLEDLLYVSPLGEGDATIEEWVEDPTDERNGLPKTYELDLANGNNTQSVDVHHSRVIHVAQGVLDDEVHGQPALEPVINRLYDLEKVLGSSAEAFWMVSNPGLALSVDPELQDVPTDQLDEQVDEYEHNLRRVLKMYGVDVEQLDAQDVDPTGVVDALIKVIAGTISFPQRKLVGSERGELASSQDEANFNEYVSSNQTKYAEPVILRETFDRFRSFGVISDPGGDSYTVEWPDLFELTALEEAELIAKQAEAIKNLAPMGEPDALHSLEELREFSPIEVEDADAAPAAGPPAAGPTADEPPLDETDPEVVDEFGRIAGDAEEEILEALESDD